MFKVLSDQRNKNQNDPAIPPYIIRMAKIKISGDNAFWIGCGERGTLLNCWQDCNLVQNLWTSVWLFLRKLEIDTPEE